MAVAVAHDPHLERAQGQLEGAADCKLNEVVSFHRFREKLAKQMLKCDPRDGNWAGDENFRVATQQQMRDRTPSRSCSRSPATRSSNSTVTLAGSATGDHLPAGNKRLCDNLTKLTQHGLSLVELPKRAHKVCVVCGRNCCHLSKNCGVGVQKPPSGEERSHASVIGTMLSFAALQEVTTRCLVPRGKIVSSQAMR